MSTARHIVIGASGLVGRPLFRRLRALGRSVIGSAFTHPAPGLAPYDMRDTPLRGLVPRLGADDTVYLLAAASHQDWVAQNADEARALNVDATAQRIEEAFAAGARVVFLSSESVFGGADAGHGEDDQLAPATVYGRHKAEIERVLAGSTRQRWIIARSGWIEGAGADARGAVRSTYDALLKPGARMAADNILTLTDVNDTVAALVALVDGAHDGIWHVAANPPVARVALADAIISASRNGSRMAYRAAAYADLVRGAPRAANAWLRNDKIARVLGMSFTPPLATIRRRVGEIETPEMAAAAGARG